jgi:hypothetical protein
MTIRKCGLQQPVLTARQFLRDSVWLSRISCLRSQSGVARARRPTAAGLGMTLLLAHTVGSGDVNAVWSLLKPCLNLTCSHHREMEIHLQETQMSYA